MTDDAGRVDARGRRSERSPEAAWDRLGDIAERVGWDTAWLSDRDESSAERSEPRE